MHPGTSAAPLREQQLRVREAPSLSALALALGVRQAPSAEVIRPAKPQATVCFAHLLPASLGVAGPILGLAIAGPPTTCAGVVTLDRPGLMDAQAKTVGELASASVTALS